VRLSRQRRLNRATTHLGHAYDRKTVSRLNNFQLRSEINNSTGFTVDEFFALVNTSIGVTTFELSRLSRADPKTGLTTTRGHVPRVVEIRG
jgi:hypothetical protein